jgi:hypothetical protein
MLTVDHHHCLGCLQTRGCLPDGSQHLAGWWGFFVGARILSEQLEGLANSCGLRLWLLWLALLMLVSDLDKQPFALEVT